MWTTQVREWEGSGVGSGGVKAKDEAGGDGEEEGGGTKNGEEELSEMVGSG